MKVFPDFIVYGSQPYPSTSRCSWGSQRLAVALSRNNTLTSLDLSYNSVTPAAAIVLAHALKVRYNVHDLVSRGVNNKRASVSPPYCTTLQ